MHTFPQRGAGLLALALVAGLAACEPKGTTPPTPSTATGTHKGILQGDKEALQVRDPSTSTSGQTTLPTAGGVASGPAGGQGLPGNGSQGPKTESVAPTLPGGGLPQAQPAPPAASR